MFRSLDGSWNRLWFCRGTSAHCGVTKLWRRCQGFFGSFLYTVLRHWRVLKAECCAFWDFLSASVCSVCSAGLLYHWLNHRSRRLCVGGKMEKRFGVFCLVSTQSVQTQRIATSSAVAGQHWACFYYVRSFSILTKTILLKLFLY